MPADTSVDSASAETQPFDKELKPPPPPPRAVATGCRARARSESGRSIEVIGDVEEHQSKKPKMDKGDLEAMMTAVQSMLQQNNVSLMNDIRGEFEGVKSKLDAVQIEVKQHDAKFVVMEQKFGDITTEFSEKFMNMEKKMKELDESRSAAASSVASAASTAASALDEAKLARNMHNSNMRKVYDRWADDKNKHEKSHVFDGVTSSPPKHVPRYVQITGWVRWQTESEEESKLSYNDAHKLFTAVMEFLARSGKTKLIDEENTVGNIESRVNITKICFFFKEDVTSSQRWAMLKTLRGDFECSEMPFSEISFQFALEPQQDKKEMYQRVGKFWSFARSKKIHDKLKHQYVNDSVKFYHVAVKGGKGKQVASWDTSDCVWKIDAENMKVLLPSLTAEAIVGQLQ